MARISREGDHIADVLHAGGKLDEALFALAAADELADFGDEQVEGCYGFSIVIISHVEGFDLGGVIGEEDGFLQENTQRERAHKGSMITVKSQNQVSEKKCLLNGG